MKAENPGVDLLIAADWDKLVGSRAINDTPPAELSGIGVLLTDPEPASPPEKSKPPTTGAGPKLEQEKHGGKPSGAIDRRPVPRNSSPATLKPVPPTKKSAAASRQPNANATPGEARAALRSWSGPKTASIFAWHLSFGKWTWILGGIGVGLIALGVLLGRTGK